jgi:hypothetical protein
MTDQLKRGQLKWRKQSAGQTVVRKGAEAIGVRMQVRRQIGVLLNRHSNPGCVAEYILH